MNAPVELQPGDPIPPEQTGGMAGLVVGECGHRVAGSEWRTGFRNCERCGDEADLPDEEPDDRCVSCGAEVDHHLGCPDDSNPDYAAEAEIPCICDTRRNRDCPIHGDEERGGR